MPRNAASTPTRLSIRASAGSMPSARHGANNAPAMKSRPTYFAAAMALTDRPCMNTPKPLSVLSSTTGNAAQARLGKAARPARGLDFSQLLGERRDASVAAVTGRASYTEQSNRSADRVADRNNGSQPARAKPAQNEQAPNNRNDRDTQPVARQNTAPAERDSKSSGAAPANTTANDNVVSRPNDPSANAQNESGNAQPGQQPGAQGSTDAAPTDAELAQNAAETGVAAAVA